MHVAIARHLFGTTHTLHPTSHVVAAVSQNGLTSRAVAAIGVAFAADTGLLPGLTPTNPRGQPWTGGLCAPLSCKADGSLQVTLDNQTFTCATGSSVALADLPGSRFAAGSIINCPDTALMCSADYSQMDKYGELTCGALNHCSGGGECYKGTCYCFVGRTGAITTALPQSHVLS